MFQTRSSRKKRCEKMKTQKNKTKKREKKRNERITNPMPLSVNICVREGTVTLDEWDYFLRRMESTFKETLPYTKMHSIHVPAE
jgi:hypothetical protein